MDFTWTSGRITSIEDWTGREASYTWTGSNLTAASDLAGADTTYGYSGAKLNQVTSPEGRVTTIGYVSGSNKILEIGRRKTTGVDLETTYRVQHDRYLHPPIGGHRP